MPQQQQEYEEWSQAAELSQAVGDRGRSGMTRAELEAKLKADPRFKIVREPGAGFVIPGAHAPATKTDADGGDKSIRGEDDAA
jgi:hypothetical protein